MYEVAAFRETRIETMHDLVRTHPLATLVMQGEGGAGGGFEADHIPLLVDPEPAPYGCLRGHVARANPLWRREGAAVLAIFQGPQGYVTPSWYPSKAEHGKVVPTWNYAVVHAHGELVVHDDPAWLRALVTRLTASQEAKLPQPWAVSDAPADYIDSMVKAIVGIEIPIRRLEGKWKMSQNRTPRDRAGVMAGLEARSDEASHALLAAIKP